VPYSLEMLGDSVVGTLCARVLIADDDRDTADTTAHRLRLDGHEVSVVYDGMCPDESLRAVVRAATEGAALCRVT
jgi:DNA-binding response OmpR family regulator